jgi:signal transduction histidine kinase
LKQRRDWFACQLEFDPSRLVFIDETGASTNLSRKSGRCWRGRRLRAAVPHGHYKTVTLVAGPRLGGLVAQKAFDRPINAASFEDWVEQCLVPTLSQGDVVVMDNLSSHKGPRVEQLIKTAGAELRYLPPYSPDMNPIEKAYSKLKAFLRKIAERSVAGLMRALEACADIFKPAECENYFMACGIFSLRGARRLKMINETIIRIMQGDLQERLPAHGKMDDLNFVASAVNLMLDEIGRLLNQLKSVGDNIAHDLRAPLAVMHAKLERGLVGQSDQDLRIAAKRALADLDQALATVSALLRISEIEFGRRRSAFTRVDLTEVCRNVFELYEPLAEAKEIKFTLEAREPVFILGDFDLLVEAIANLVDNAIKFTPRGGLVSITVKANLAGFLIRVSDNGPGIAPFEREQIFKRFYRSQKCHHIPGTGLGLSMAATIADVHGFDLRVEDNQPGAAFVICPRQAA